MRKKTFGEKIFSTHPSFHDDRIFKAEEITKLLHSDQKQRGIEILAAYMLLTKPYQEVVCKILTTLSKDTNVFNIVNEIVQKIKHKTEISNAEYQKLLSDFIKIFYTHLNPIFSTDTYDKYLVFYYLISVIHVEVKDFHLKINEDVIKDIIAIFAYCEASDENNAEITSQIFFDHSKDNYESNKCFFINIIEKLNKKNAIHFYILCAKFQLITYFIKYCLQRGYHINPEDIRSLIGYNFTGDFNAYKKNKLIALYNNVIIINHFLKSDTTSTVDENNNNSIRARAHSAAEYSDLIKFSSIAKWRPKSEPTLVEADPLQHLIEKLEPYQCTQLFPYISLQTMDDNNNNNFLNQFWMAKNIQERIHCAFNLVLEEQKTGAKQFSDQCVVYLSVVLNRPANEINAKLYQWLVRLNKELGFDCQPYTSDYMRQTFIEMEKMNLSKLLNSNNLEVSDAMVSKVINARERWIAEKDLDFNKVIIDIFNSEHGDNFVYDNLTEKKDKDFFQKILFLQNLTANDCSQIKLTKLRRAVENNKVCIMEKTRFVFEYILLILKKMFDNFNTDLVLKKQDFSEDFIIRSEFFIKECENTHHPMLLEFSKKLNILLTKNEVVLEKKLLDDLEEKSEYKKVLYFNPNNLDIFIPDQSKFKVQQIFIDQYDRLVWFLVKEGHLVIEPVNTKSHFSHTKPGWGLATIKEQIFLASHEEHSLSQQVHHSSSVKSCIVDAALELKIHDKCLEGTPHTGHYLIALILFLCVLENLPISPSLIVYLKNNKKIAEFRDKLEISESVSTNLKLLDDNRTDNTRSKSILALDFERSLDGSYPIFYYHCVNLVKDPTVQLKKGAKRCYEVLTFLYKFIPENALSLNHGEEQTDSIKNLLSKLIYNLNKLLQTKTVDRENLSMVLLYNNYDFRYKGVAFNFYCTELNSILLPHINETLSYLDYVKFKPQELIKDNYFVVGIYNFFDTVCAELNAIVSFLLAHNSEKLKDFLYMIEKLRDEFHFSKIYEEYQQLTAHFVIHDKPTAEKYEFLLSELKINPLIVEKNSTVNEAFPCQIFRFILCVALYDYCCEKTSWKKTTSVQVLGNFYVKIVKYLLDYNNPTTSEFFSAIEAFLETHPQDSNKVLFRSLLNTRLKYIYSALCHSSYQDSVDPLGDLSFFYQTISDTAPAGLTS